MGMMFFWIAAVALLVWYMGNHQEQRPAWVWIVVGLLALPLFGMFFGGYGIMGGGYGYDHGMMGFRGPGGFGGGGLAPGAPGQAPGTWGGPGYMGIYGGTYWWVAMAIQALLFIGGITLVYFLVQRNWKPAPAVTPLGTLQMRLAKGEITGDQFEELRKKLDAQ